LPEKRENCPLVKEWTKYKEMSAMMRLFVISKIIVIIAIWIMISISGNISHIFIILNFVIIANT
jgi:hypothetical protein